MNRPECIIECSFPEISHTGRYMRKIQFNLRLIMTVNHIHKCEFWCCHDDITLAHGNSMVIASCRRDVGYSESASRRPPTIDAGETSSVLIHWSRYIMTAISITTPSNAISWMKNLDCSLKVHRSLILMVQLTIVRLWLGADQAPNHYLNQWWLEYRCIYTSLGRNDLRYHLTKWDRWLGSSASFNLRVIKQFCICIPQRRGFAGSGPLPLNEL